MAETQKKSRVFKTYTYRGIELDSLLQKKQDELLPLFTSRIRRKHQRGLKKKEIGLLKKLRESKAKVVGAEAGVKPATVKTHLRNCVIVPEMVGAVAGVYSGKEYVTVEIKAEMIGHYLGEFSFSYRPVKHGRPGIGATHSSRFIPLR